jgi:hypothetical protein
MTSLGTERYNMPWRGPPRVNLDEEPQYLQQSWRIGYELKDVFSILHEKFNTVPMFIQDRDAFYSDVAELISNASDKEDFDAKLQERREQRLKELKDFERNIKSWMIRGHSPLNDDQMKAFIDLCREASLNSLILFLTSLLVPNKHGSKPLLGSFVLTR